MTQPMRAVATARAGFTTRVLGWDDDTSLLSRILVFSAAALVLSTIIVQIITADPTGTVATVGIVIGNLSAGALFIHFSRGLEPRERRAWRFVGTGLALSAVGVTGVGVILLAEGSAPSFSAFDALFISAYGLMLVGLALLPQFIGGHSRTRLFLDGAIGAVSLGTLAWVLLFDELTAALAGAPIHEVLIALLYPVLDITTIVMVTIVIVRRSTFRFDLRLITFGLAMVCQAVGDLSYAISAVGKSFDEAEPVYLAFLLASLGYVVAATMVGKTPPRHEYADQRPPWWSLVAPYGSAAVVVGVLSMSLFRGEVSGTDLALYLAALTVAVLVIFRQITAINENRLLVENERAALVSSISHELRTPLTSVVGYLGLLDDDDHGFDSDEDQEMIAFAHEQAKYMSHIVTDLVMLSRDDPSYLTINRTAVPMRTLAGEAVRVAGTSDLVRTDIPGYLVAHIDQTRMRQAVVNLLDNARRYGGPLHLLKAYNENRDLVIEVHDNGSGIPVKYELSVWERFERGPNRLNAQVPGSGIGLALVSLIVRAHGGLARYVQSSVLGGACFRLWLPGCVSWDEESTADLEPVANAGLLTRIASSEEPPPLSIAKPR